MRSFAGGATGECGFARSGLCVMDDSKLKMEGVLKRIIVMLVLVLLVATSIFADTKIGRAKPNSLQNWRFTPFVNGQAQIVLSWTSKNATLFMVLVCGISNPLTFGASGGGLNRVAIMDVGLIAGVPCLLGVTSFQGTSGYRAHFNHTRGINSSSAGRVALVLPADARDERTLLASEVERVRAALQREWERSQ